MAKAWICIPGPGEPDGRFAECQAAARFGSRAAKADPRDAHGKGSSPNTRYWRPPPATPAGIAREVLPGRCRHVRSKRAECGDPKGPKLLVRKTGRKGPCLKDGE